MYRHYKELGMSLMPVNGKRAFLDNWEQLSDRLPEEWEIRTWELANRKNNIGLLMGTEIDQDFIVCSLDEDTNIKEILKHCPLSPVIKAGRRDRGNKFFKCKKTIRNTDIKITDDKEHQIQLLVKGRQTVMPPSIHPDTKEPYIWLTPDTLLNYDLKDLPEITEDDISDIRKAVDQWRLHNHAEYIKYVNNEPSGKQKTFGRNSTLVEIVSSMRFRGETETKITEEIYNFDKDKHNPRLFTDKDEKFEAHNEDDAFNNAFIFQASVTHSIFKSGKAKIKLSQSNNDLKFLDTSKPLFEPKKLPEPSGFMKHVYDEIINSAYIPHENYALCGSLMLTATLACGRFHYMGNHPVLYSMVIAGTGWGKEAPVKVLKRILTHERMRNYKLMGYGSYTSSQTIAIRLPKQRSLLDIFDEMGTFFRGQGKSSENYHREITDELLKLFSNQGSFYHGKVSMKRQETGDCFSPFVNLMGFIQPELFEETVSQVSVSQGFLPRFLIFNTEKHSNYNKDANDYVLNVDQIVGMALAKFPHENVFGISNAELITMEKDALRNLKPKPIAVSASNDFKTGIKALGEEYAKKAINENNSMISPFHTRVNELVKRVSLVHAVSEARDAESICLNQGNLDWAKNLVEALHYNMTEKLKNIAPMTDDVKKSYKMLEKIKEIFLETKQPVKPRDVYKAMNISKKQFETYRDNLVAFGKVCLNKTMDNWNDTLSPLED